MLHIDSAQRENLYKSIINCIVDNQPEVEGSELIPPQLDVPEVDTPCLLSSLLPQFQSRQNSQVHENSILSQVQSEIEMYKQLPSCPMVTNPLDW